MERSVTHSRVLGKPAQHQVMQQTNPGQESVSRQQREPESNQLFPCLQLQLELKPREAHSFTGCLGPRKMPQVRIRERAGGLV